MVDYEASRDRANIGFVHEAVDKDALAIPPADPDLAVTVAVVSLDAGVARSFQVRVWAWLLCVVNVRKFRVGVHADTVTGWENGCQEMGPENIMGRGVARSLGWS